MSTNGSEDLQPTEGQSTATASIRVSDVPAAPAPRPSDLAQGSKSKSQESTSWEIDMSDCMIKPKGKRRQAKKPSKPASQENSSKPGKGKARAKKQTPLDERSLNATQSCPDLLSRPGAGNGAAAANGRAAMPTHGVAQRKVMDARRWFCMVRPQYKASCGISSLVSVWNYLHSTLGSGTLRPITQEEALEVLGFKPPFGEIRFGPFTGNATLMRWFQELNRRYGVSGISSLLYKPIGTRQTSVSEADALESIKVALRGENTALIYHCHNHYFCPLGFEETPKLAVHAYSGGLAASEVDTWLLIGDPSRTNQPIRSLRWVDVCKDLQLASPQYFNIRHPEKGILTRRPPAHGGPSKRAGTTLHCIMAFRKTESLKRVYVTAATSAPPVPPVAAQRAPLRCAPNTRYDILWASEEERSRIGPWTHHEPGTECRECDVVAEFHERGALLLRAQTTATVAAAAAATTSIAAAAAATAAAAAAVADDDYDVDRNSDSDLLTSDEDSD